jgi:hypothetical protein
MNLKRYDLGGAVILDVEEARLQLERTTNAYSLYAWKGVHVPASG